jgi:hypothetical protein
VIINRLIRTFDREPGSFVCDDDATPLKGSDERVAVGVHFDEYGLCFLRERVDLSCVHEMAALKHNDAVTRALDIGHEMRREQHADAELPVRFPDECQHLFASHGIESGGGLVEKHERRIMHERLREFHTLLHARRISADRAVPLLEQSRVPQSVCRARACCRRWKAVGLGHVGEKLRRAHLTRQAVMLRHVAKPRAHGDARRCVLSECDSGA